jgi:hypothetical protein
MYEFAVGSWAGRKDPWSDAYRVMGALKSAKNL